MLMLYANKILYLFHTQYLLQHLLTHANVKHDAQMLNFITPSITIFNQTDQKSDTQHFVAFLTPSVPFCSIRQLQYELYESFKRIQVRK